MTRPQPSVRRTPSKLLRYAGTAGAAAIVDLGGFSLIVAVDVPVLLAAAISFLAATIVNYTLTARFVFAVAPKVRRYPRFLAAASAGFLINVGVTSATHALGVPPVIAKVAGIGTAFLLNFAINATVVFR